MKKLKKKLLKKPKSKKLKEYDFLSTGHTPINLACTGRIDGGIVLGVYTNLIGESDTGKSVLGMSILAEAAINKRFKDYSLEYVNSEHSHLLDPAVFCPPLADRINIREDIDSPEGFYYYAIDKLKKGPCIMILDSMDALTPMAEDKKFAKQKLAFEKGKDAAGSYNLDKQKENAKNLRKVCSLLSKDPKNKSAVVIISQSKDLISQGPFSFGPRKYRSGGGSMKFYTRMEIWLSNSSQIKKEYKGKKIQIGSNCLVKVDKNHITGKKRQVRMTVYNDYGVDDTGDCIDWLIDMSHWKGTKKTVQAKEFDFKGKKAELIKYIEKKSSRVWKLRKLVKSIWDEMEKTVEMKRRPKYEAW